MPLSSAARAPFHQPRTAAAAVPALCIDGSGDGSVSVVATSHLLRKDEEKTRRGVSSAVSSDHDVMRVEFGLCVWAGRTSQMSPLLRCLILGSESYKVAGCWAGTSVCRGPAATVCCDFCVPVVPSNPTVKL